MVEAISIGGEKNLSYHKWQVICASVRGASHIRVGLPNQDDLFYLPKTKVGPRLLLAVADGHGGAKHFRSDVGAHCAVSAATSVLRPLMRVQLNQESYSSIKLW